MYTRQKKADRKNTNYACFTMHQKKIGIFPKEIIPILFVIKYDVITLLCNR